MVVVDDILADSMASTIMDWFEPTFNHPFLSLQTIVVPDSQKPIPKRWIDEVQIDENLFKEDGVDLFGDGPSGTTWSMEEGKARLKDALQRLDLSEDHVAHPNLNRMNRHELAAEKRRVKQELKSYDGYFRRQFARLPNHSEKEAMRPLYVYYRRLKTMITHSEQTQQNRHGRRGGSGAGNGDEGSGLGFGQRESLATIPDLDDTPRTGNSGGRATSIEDQIAALEGRIETLQSEKSAVRAKLQSFQEKFVNENNRKIRFHKDILPIEREYRTYKTLKEDIMKVEQQLRDLRSDA